MDISKLSLILKTEPKFRFKQAYQALFSDYISNWQELTAFPLSLREKLNKECPLAIKAKLIKSQSGQGEKALISLKDGLEIETVLIKQANNRYTVCLSSQLGCPLACSFCLSGSLAFKRNLDKLEIIEQFLFWARYLKKDNKKINNLVFMGMGEPLLNYDNLVKAINFLNSQEAFNFGARRISISTVGLSKEIKKLAKEPWQVNLAVSLHAPTDDLRKTLMPKAVKLASLTDIFKAVDYYLTSTNRRLMFEYLMLDKINDSDLMARQLIPLMKKPLYFLNLIPYNQSQDSKFKASSWERIRSFANILSSAGVKVTIRHSHGDDIMAACGQLANLDKQS